MEPIKVTKTIRFKLLPEHDNALIQTSIANLNNNCKFDLSKFVKELDKYIGGVNEHLFYEKKDGNFAIKDKMVIKKEWLQKYAKQGLAEIKKNNQKKSSNQTREVQTTIGDIKGLSNTIENIFDIIDGIYCELEKDASAGLNERAKRARTALLLKRLSVKNALPCLVSLIENTLEKKEIGDLSLRLKGQGLELMKQLLLGIQEYLPEQSNGIPITKASFNYYTINKKPVDYERKKKEISDKLNVTNGLINVTDKVSFSSYLWERISEDVKKQLKNKQLILGDSPFADIDNYASLRQILKNILATQKSRFQELMQNKSLYKKLQEENGLYLFKDISKGEFDEYSIATEEIEEKGTAINECTNDSKKKQLRSDLQKLKKERGSLINAGEKYTKNKFTTYKSFIKLYRIVSQKHGKLLAQLKGIEKEKTESQLLNYWALILEANNQHKLVLIPKEKAGECRCRLCNTSVNNEMEKLYWFESFTFRSLQKLCFGNIDNDTKSNTFYPGIKKELFSKYLFTDNKGYVDFIKGEYEFKGDEQKKIQFYKDVLCSKYAKQVLNLPINEIRETIINQSFNSLDDFIIALEKICYCRFVTVNKNIIDALSDSFNAQIFNITSLDLQNAINSQGKEDVLTHADKAHTQIWKSFWKLNNEKSNYDIRLNPEVTITYRKPKQSRLDKYGKGCILFDEKKRNRYLHDQLTLIMTLSEHSNAPAKDLSFISEDEFKTLVEKFNKTFNTEKINFAFGIDNGEVELSTLGVYLPNFEKPSNKEKIAELQKVKEYGFKVLTITDLSYIEKDVNGKDKKIIQNPSYFLNKELYCRIFGKDEMQYNEMFKHIFEEKYLLTLDLTTAKVINGQIISNGDIPSLFNLWMRHAQRNIYEMNDHVAKKTAKHILLKKSDELIEDEKKKFIEYLNEDNKKYKELSENTKTEYVKWMYDSWNNKDVLNSEFEKIKKGQRVGNFSKNVLFAVCCIGKEIQHVVDVFNVRNIFKLRKDFYSIKSEEEIISEIKKYNTRSLSNEELDLKMSQLKQSLVANVIGVIDLLYKQYGSRFGGEGIIVKEGFDSNKVDEDRDRFSGNVYRMLERKLYQKFQNYGLVPPIKNLLQLRTSGITNNGFMQLGNVCFIDPTGTSQNCPVCNNGKLEHSTVCQNACGFCSEGIMHSNDGIAGFNIAKRGFENLKKLKKNYNEI